MAIELRGSTIAVKIRLEMVMKIINTVVEFLSVQIIRRSYQCKQCDDTFSTINNLKKHRRRQQIKLETQYCGGVPEKSRCKRIGDKKFIHS